MNSRKDKILAYFIAAILLLAGVVSYAAFPHRAPDEPVRIMLENTAGNVLFSHKTHASEDGYGLLCDDCHHMWEEGEGMPEACGECHEVDSEDPVKRSEAFHLQCVGCHEDYDAGAISCSECHAL